MGEGGIVGVALEKSCLLCFVILCSMSTGSPRDTSRPPGVATCCARMGPQRSPTPMPVVAAP